MNNVRDFVRHVKRPQNAESGKAGLRVPGLSWQAFLDSRPSVV